MHRHLRFGKRSLRVGFLILIWSLLQFLYGQPLPPVSGDDWGLKIVIFEVGQADAAVALTPNGDAAVIDIGRTIAQGRQIGDYLLDADQNGVESIAEVLFVIASHYDADHIGGAAGLSERVQILRAYDQGPSAKRDALNLNTVYSRYVRAVGDLDGDGFQGEGEEDFVRHRAYPGLSLRLGHHPAVQLLVLSVNGNTFGLDHDLDLDPSSESIDENPGSVALFVRFGHFEYLSCGDATSDDWKYDPDTEEQLIAANAIPGGDDIDVLKVNHHGSDTSTGQRFVTTIQAELAIISTDLTNHRLPKLTTLRVLEMNNTQVLVTGQATEENGDFHQSQHAFDDGFVPSGSMFRDRQGRITILVASDGNRYTVRAEGGFQQTFSAVDTENEP